MPTPSHEHRRWKHSDGSDSKFSRSPIPPTEFPGLREETNERISAPKTNYTLSGAVSLLSNLTPFPRLRLDTTNLSVGKRTMMDSDLEKRN